MKHILSFIFFISSLVSTSQILPDLIDYADIKWFCDESDLIEALNLSVYQKYIENDSIAIIEYQDEINGIVFHYSYLFENGRLKEIMEAFTLDTLNSYYVEVMNFVIVEQLLCAEEFGSPILYTDSIKEFKVNFCEYQYMNLKIEFLSFYHGSHKVFNKNIRIY